MARNEILETKVREALAGVPNVEEKVMFRGIAFMVNGKLCISAGDAELMFRIDPVLHEEAIQKGCREMLRNGKAIKGYVYVHQQNVETKKDLEYWIGLSLDYNNKAKASKKKSPR
jgi:TfoX/Sxy family transcriptional regulator of competence genes